MRPLFGQVDFLGRSEVGCPTRFRSTPVISSMTGKTIEDRQGSPHVGFRIQWGQPLIAEPPQSRFESIPLRWAKVKIGDLP